jgi:hypothetical protein
MATKKAGRSVPEKEAVRTTIVGARPPGSGKSIGNIPRGIEVLVKKASVDAEFKKVLVEKRAGAAGEIGLDLELAETMMLDNVPAAQLEVIIANTRVGPKSKAAFLGRAAAVMLAALGAGIMGCGDGDYEPTSEGMRPDRPEDKKPAAEAQVEEETESSDDDATIRGIRPDRPKQETDATEKVEREG